MRSLASGLYVHPQGLQQTALLLPNGPQPTMVAVCPENANLYHELNLKFHAVVLLLANNQRAQIAYDDYVKKMHHQRPRAAAEQFGQPYSPVRHVRPMGVKCT